MKPNRLIWVRYAVFGVFPVFVVALSMGGCPPEMVPEPFEQVSATAQSDGMVTITSSVLSAGSATFRIEDLDGQAVANVKATIIRHGNRAIVAFERDGYVPVAAIVNVGDDGKIVAPSRLKGPYQQINNEGQIRSALHAIQSSLFYWLVEVAKKEAPNAVSPIKIAKSAIDLVALFESPTLAWDPPESFIARLAYKGTASLRDIQKILGVAGAFTLLIPEPSATKVVSATLFGGTLTIDLLGVAGVDLDRPYDWYQVPGTQVIFCLPNSTAPRTEGITLESPQVVPSQSTRGQTITISATIHARHPRGLSEITRVEVRFLTPDGKLHDFNVFELTDLGANGDVSAGDGVYSVAFPKNPQAKPGTWTAVFAAIDNSQRSAESLTTYHTINQ